MFIVIQSFPDEKILFASDSEKEATNYFHLQIQHGKGSFQLWQENNDIPILSGGEEQFYSTPVQSSVSAYEV